MRWFLVFLICCVCDVGYAQPQADPSEAKIETAREIIKLSHVADMITKAYGESLSQRYTDLIAQEIPKMGISPAPVRKDVLATLTQKEVDDQFMPDALEFMAREYARTFTEKELSDLLAFYKSPSGSAMLAKQPVAMSAMLRYVRGGARNMLESILLKYCVQINCPAKDFDRIKAIEQPVANGAQP